MNRQTHIVEFFFLHYHTIFARSALKDIRRFVYTFVNLAALGVEMHFA